MWQPIKWGSHLFLADQSEQTARLLPRLHRSRPNYGIHSCSPLHFQIKITQEVTQNVNTISCPSPIPVPNGDRDPAKFKIHRIDTNRKWAALLALSDVGSNDNDCAYFCREAIVSSWSIIAYKNRFVA
jgi:hypothetical protein